MVFVLGPGKENYAERRGNWEGCSSRTCNYLQISRTVCGKPRKKSSWNHVRKRCENSDTFTHVSLIWFCWLSTSGYDKLITIVIFSRKLCVQSEAKFDFLKDLVVGIQDLQGEMDEQVNKESFSHYLQNFRNQYDNCRTLQPQTPIVSPRDNPLRSSFGSNEAISKPQTLPRQISTFKPR